jgi:adenylosuccinate synthase
MGKLIVIAGGQYGSEGKGAIAGYLAKEEPAPLLAMRVAGPNAGHTVYDETGRQFKFQQIPVAAATNKSAQLAIAAGSEIDVEQFRLETTWDPTIARRLTVDGSATIIDSDRDAGFHESSENFGGTGKGVNRARAARLRREATLAYDDMVTTAYVGDTQEMAIRWLKDNGTVMVEGTQGFGLGTHSGSYPHCTGSDCRAIDFLSMAGISPWASYVDEMEIWLVFRTYPIRVAGNSGPLLGETTWDALGVPAEQTTVTKKTRRVGTWDPELAERAIEANGGYGAVRIALTFFDYLHPETQNRTYFPDESIRALHTLENFKNELGRVDLVGTGPRTLIDYR